MAVWKRKIAGCEVKIHDMDHLPPHCHAFVEGKDLKITLFELSVMNPPPNDPPTKLRKGLAALQEELLEAWEDVRIIPSGGAPEWGGTK